MIKKVTIEILKGITAGQKFEYEGEKRISIGRQDDCDIVFPDMTVSKHHCILEISQYEVKLSDAGSKNGTYINNRLIGKRDINQSNDEHILQNGDEIGLGISCKLICTIQTEDTMSEEESLPESINGNFRDFETLENEILEQIIGTQRNQNSAQQLMFDGYLKICCLGRGGFGRVWKVQDPETDRYYALKSMVYDINVDDDAVKRMLRESGINEFLSHKNVVRTYRTDYADGKFYFLMDICEGGSLKDLIKRKGGKLSLIQATWIILQVLSGLDYIHNIEIPVALQSRMFSGKKETSVKGIVHRDLKPDNIYLSDTSDFPVAKIGDFGMAKAYELAGISRITNDGHVFGTAKFMSRQQAVDCMNSKPEVDVWAAAATYYYMLTGEYAKNFRKGINEWDIVVNEEARSISEFNTSIDEKIAEVIDKALTEKPKIGYSTAAEFREKLVTALPAKIRNAVQDVI